MRFYLFDFGPTTLVLKLHRDMIEKCICILSTKLVTLVVKWAKQIEIRIADMDTDTDLHRQTQPIITYPSSLMAMKLIIF